MRLIWWFLRHHAAGSLQNILLPLLLNIGLLALALFGFTTFRLQWPQPSERHRRLFRRQ
jgi:two-component system sensor histidine kinase RcsD